MAARSIAPATSTAWGEGTRFASGRPDQPTDQRYARPVRIAGGDDVVAVAVDSLTFAVTRVGALLCVGCSGDRLSHAISALAPVRAVATHSRFVCVFERAGAVRCWNGWHDHDKAPAFIGWPALAGASVITVRDAAACGLVGGRVGCQHTLAWQADDSPKATQDSQPGRTETPIGDRGGSDEISGGATLGCAAGAAGTTCWDTRDRRQVPHGLHPIWLAGPWPFCAVSDDGLRCFDGLLDPPPARPQLADVAHVAVGAWKTCAVTTGGALLCWRGSSGREGCGPAKPRRLDVE